MLRAHEHALVFEAQAAQDVLQVPWRDLRGSARSFDFIDQRDGGHVRLAYGLALTLPGE